MQLTSDLRRQVKPEDIALAKQQKAAKRGSKKQADIIDAIAGNGEKEDHNDSFEKYYNKDLDLDEGKTSNFQFSDQVPVVIYELSESAVNFIT